MKKIDDAKKLEKLLDRLYKRQNFGIKMDLQVAEAFLRHMGQPQLNYGAIHVAGTNGKGSVCAMLDSVMRAAGYKVGLYTSPHLVRFNERIKVDNIEISDSELAYLFEEMEPLIKKVAAETKREPTFFECTTAMALDYFAGQGINLAVIETGLGGRLDATNVVVPLVSVITRISLEHTQYLGSDLAAIAGEKAGIIKKNRPVVCGAMPPEALEVMKQTAGQRRSQFVNSAESVSVRLISSDLTGQKVSVETSDKSYGTIHLPLLGSHQIENLATVIAAVDCLSGVADMGLSVPVVKKGIETTRWPGRLQVLSTNPPVLLDGAHNPGAAAAIVETLGGLLKGRPLGLVVGMCDDKDLQGFLGAFSGMATKLWAVPLKTTRSRDASVVAIAGEQLGWKVEESVLPEAMKEGTEWATRNGGVLLICGSLFLVGEVLEESVRRI